MELLHFDTENRKAAVRLDYTEVLNLASMLLHAGPKPATITVKAAFGEVEIQAVKP